VVRKNDPSAGPFDDQITGGVAWLAKHQNADGGWGDTDKSYSNIATTMLVRAAFHLAGRAAVHVERLAHAERYIASKGGLDGLRARYGRDKTFAVPILTNCALAGLVPWSEVAPLPFELACVPQRFYRFVRLPVVSYAIPALVAIGQVRYHHRKPRLPWMWLVRRLAIQPALRVLHRIQPASGGYLEAAPLTSFVVMSLAASGRADHPVSRAGVRFLLESIRSDGSWPIDTNLATWTTTLAINALAAAGEDVAALGCLDWLLDCQYREVHPFTGAEPGGWGWSDLSGAVPDADDTPGALLALAAWRDAPSCSDTDRQRIAAAARAGIRWLQHLQNRDGGWPTFCRGWGKLPFDRSGADLTAHALRAFAAWHNLDPRATGVSPLQPAPTPTNTPNDQHSEQQLARRATETDMRWPADPAIHRSTETGFRYLASQQRSDGSWVPLWFGNQDHPHEENPVYGTAKVLHAYRDLGRMDAEPARRAARWLTTAQNSDGGWGGGPGGGSVEETALAVEALASTGPGHDAMESLHRGTDWLVNAVEQDRHRAASPIGFYFAKLWYYERLYPLVFTLAALGRARGVLEA
jgi:squalene-hopene/tetraprenyl-beta-curcumene cyclase